eukprot:CAMPEP_0197516384 /NCGR_PEP_ID=MMETSP1318-20131121/1279_1 /TAXON_ID=552666 /ORGANISM="Partenskyella glossopodia, Strain RCC365" /LENGTH=154 /DNA_ID=CAMNT_0043065101 /DNA_START=108 /DNA_END=572 /DNA_ORIENTATION=+
MDDILVKKKIGALSASPSAYFIRKLQQKDVADKKRLRTVATLKIIRVMVHQDMYEFAVPDRTLVHELTFLIKERLRAEAKAKVGYKGKGDIVAGSVEDPCSGKQFKFYYRGRPLVDTLDSVQPGDTISLFIVSVLKRTERSVCRSLCTCTCGRF